MLPGNRPASMPMKPNSRPVAARPKATGMPVSRKKNRPANISGTKFWAMKAVMSLPRAGQQGGLAARRFLGQGLSELLFVQLVVGLGEGFLAMPRQEGHPLGQLGDALQRQQR